MISCLTITQPGREELLALSIRCFAEQSFSPRELIVVHDGGDGFHEVILRLLDSHKELDVRVCQLEQGFNLGTLRNRSIEYAKYEIICQWDDDDLYHPDRLRYQYESLEKTQSDFCFLGDQLHYYSREGFFFWDNWASEAYPRNLIQGTLMGKKSLLGRYPDKTRGEDTELVFRLQREGKSLYCLTGHAWLYIYTFHGANAWEESHHKAISNFKRLDRQGLESKIHELTERLKPLAWNFSSAYFPHEQGGFTIRLENA
jgi:glycosyltransferase involved in cell wall biosynthesis